MSNFTDTFPGGKIARRIDDGAFESFREGWAKIPFCGNAPHFFRDITEEVSKELSIAHPDTRFFIALCGFSGVTNSRNGLMYPGNFPLCKRCMKKAPRWARREERSTELPADVLKALKK